MSQSIVLENHLNMWLAVLCPSRERRFASSLWACSHGAENSTLVHEVQSTHRKSRKQ